MFHVKCKMFTTDISTTIFPYRNSKGWSVGVVFAVQCPLVWSGSDSPANAQLLVSKENHGLPVPDLDPALGHKGKRERWLPTNSIEFGSCGLSGLRSWLMPPFVRRPHQLLNVHITSVKMNWDNPTRAELSPYYRLTMGADPCLEGLKTFQSSWQNHV